MPAPGAPAAAAAAAEQPPGVRSVEGASLLCQGAEARVWSLPAYLGRRAIAKQRFVKRYRLPALDTKLTQRRLVGEARGLCKARKLGVATPAVYAVDTQEATLYIEFVAGVTVKAFLQRSLEAAPAADAGAGSAAAYANGAGLPDASARAGVLKAVGEAVAALHDGDLVHGDLTTSNMLVRQADGRIVMIDFGLASNSSLSEDKAVDLYVLERAVSAAHPEHPDAFETILAAYKAASKQWCPTLNRFADVRARGRKRAMIG